MNSQQNNSSFLVYNASAGSGKTFTLVKEYVKILLQSENSYLFQNILAITFTNKAAAEMKERVLGNLIEFSKHNVTKHTNDMFGMILNETGLDSTNVQVRSKKVLQNILQNYSSFQIKTIDSFTNKLIKSFAFDLGLSLDFEVELDPKPLLEEVVDIIISKIGIDRELTNVLVDFAKQKTQEDKSWDVSRELKEIAKLVTNENDTKEIQKLENRTIKDFKDLEKKILLNQKEIEILFSEIGKEGLKIIHDLDIPYNCFASSDLPNLFKKLLIVKNLTPKNFKFEGRLYNSIQKRVLYSKSNKKVSADIKNRIDSVEEELIQLYYHAENIYNVHYSSYQLNKLVLKNLVPLAILNSISKVLEQMKKENNIRLNSEFNQIISKHLLEQPAAFIYEKIGEKYKHYFIDEMQDTSVLQWNNLIPLIENALSDQNSSLLLVGDAKQAIYRWRGGKAEQFIDLSSSGNSVVNNPFNVVKHSENLDTNYRSYSEIIDFNNHFFTHISAYFKKDIYQKLYEIGNSQKFNKNTGGYVQLEFIEECKNVEERDEVFPERVYETILGLDSQYERNEISILVRKKTQGIAIANYLSDKGIQIVSSETLLVKNNNKVDFIINLIQYLKNENDGDAKLNILYFIHQHLKLKMEVHNFIEGYISLDQIDFFKKLEYYQIFYDPQKFYKNPFYEGVEQLIRSFHIAKESDAYIQFFLDFVFEFSQRKFQNGMEFLDYWELKNEKLSILASNNTNAVQIMTIHKSKGLEFPVVIYPYDLDVYYQKSPMTWYDHLDKKLYNNFESILVSSSSIIENTGDYGKRIFNIQQEELELDNFNLLYVALTRAKEQLYIISEDTKIKDRLKTYSHFFKDFLQKTNKWDDGKLLYSFGENKRLSVKDKKDQNTIIQEKFISSPWQDHQFNIAINSSVLWGSARSEAIEFGNLIHEIMSNIITDKDIKKSVDQILNKGLMENNERLEIEKIVKKIVFHKELNIYFQSEKTIFTEREIITDDKEVLIPDRLIFDEYNNLTIIDYKTGNPDTKHQQQIEKYGMVLQKMNFKILEKILVYIGKEIKIVKV